MRIELGVLCSFMKQMNTVRTLIYGTIHMDSDRDKGYIKYSSFLVREGLSYAIRGFDDIISSTQKKKLEAGNI